MREHRELVMEEYEQRIQGKDEKAFQKIKRVVDSIINIDGDNEVMTEEIIDTDHSSPEQSPVK